MGELLRIGPEGGFAAEDISAGNEMNSEMNR
jgi:16S rRNA U1498 N3-methylase RsmE